MLINFGQVEAWKPLVYFFTMTYSVQSVVFLVIIKFGFVCVQTTILSRKFPSGPLHPSKPILKDAIAFSVVLACPSYIIPDFIQQRKTFLGIFPHFNEGG